MLSDGVVLKKITTLCVFEIHHVKGVNNFVADALSRNADESCIGPSGSAISHIVCVFDSRRPVVMSNAELAFG